MYLVDTDVISNARKRIRANPGKLRVPHAENPLDEQIAATALMYGLTVVTRNVSHYAPTGVAVLNPFT